MTDTALSAALKRAGFDSGVRLHAVAARCLADEGDTVRAARALWRELGADQELRMSAMIAILGAVADDMQGMPGEGHTGGASDGHRSGAPSRQPNGGGAGPGSGADGGHTQAARPSPQSRETGAILEMPKGLSRTAPSREPTATDIEAAGDVARQAARTVLDSFRITMRQGSKQAVGDIEVARYPGLLRQLGKRAWVSSREFNLIYLLNERAQKFAHVPAGHTTRDIFNADDVETMIGIATALALPITGQEKANV